jgi:hypothetical protein
LHSEPGVPVAGLVPEDSADAQLLLPRKLYVAVQASEVSTLGAKL